MLSCRNFRPFLWLKLGFNIRGKRTRLAAAACGCSMRYAVCEWSDSIHTFTHAFAPSFLVWVKGNTQIWRHIHGFPNFRHPILYLLPHESLPGAIQFAAYAAIRKSHAVSGHMESPSSVYMLFHFCRITHNACRLRLPRIWNPSLKPTTCRVRSVRLATAVLMYDGAIPASTADCWYLSASDNLWSFYRFHSVSRPVSLHGWSYVYMV